MSCRKQSAAIMKSLSMLGVRAVMLAAATSGCAIERDSVLQGVYGNMRAEGAATTTPARSVAAMSAPRATAGSSGGSTPSSAGTSAAPPPINMAMTMTTTSAVGATGGDGSAGMTAQPMAAGGGGGSAMDAAGGQAPAMSAGPCDMSGRWLGTVHYVTDALGQLQFCHTYLYYEIQQTGSTFTVTKGLHCGDDAMGEGDFAATVDLSGSWAASASRVQHMGRTGTSEAVSGGCQVSLDKWYTVRGATVPYYLDPSTTLPSAEQPGTDTTPGWEDWDMDGNPGVTGVISGVVSGKIFSAPRQWTSMSGTVAELGTLVRLPLQWDQEQNVMSYEGSPLLASSAARAADAARHFTQLARLGDGQAVGDDAAICASIMELAPTLTPEAAAN